MNPQIPNGRNDNHLMDYTKITDDIIIGSDLCRGNVCPIHGEEFKKLGVCIELNLSAEKKEIPPDILNGYIWMPVIDGHAPSADQLDLGSVFLDQAIKNDNIVYVHCKNGHGRSPTMVAAYLIRFNNKGVDEAIKFIKSKRPEVHIEDEQYKALIQFSQRWSK